MTEFAKEFEYHLEDPFTHHANGALTEVKFFTVSAPSNKQIKDVIKINQFVVKSLLGMTKKIDASASKEESGPKTELTSEQQIFQTLFSLYSSDEDMTDLLDSFKRILLNGSCKVEQSGEFTEYHYDNMSANDFTSLMARYIHTFLLSRIMQAVKG